jgi:hypothetical protein
MMVDYKRLLKGGQSYYANNVPNIEHLRNLEILICHPI